jgi:hypothetical protein
MGGFLGTYGDQAEKEYRRSALLKRAIAGVLVVAIAGATAYYTLRTHGEEQVVKQFLEYLQQHRYQDAYALWGCTQDTPCKYYSPDKFTEDWGPSSRYANAAAFKVDHVDFCDDGVVFDLAYPNSDDLGLWVQRSTNVISFAPWPRCPGRHLHLREFLKSLFNRDASA